MKRLRAEYYCWYNNELLFPCYHQEDYMHHTHPEKGSISFHKDDCIYSTDRQKVVEGIDWNETMSLLDIQ